MLMFFYFVFYFMFLFYLFVNVYVNNGIFINRHHFSIRRTLWAVPCWVVTWVVQTMCRWERKVAARRHLSLTEWIYQYPFPVTIGAGAFAAAAPPRGVRMERAAVVNIPSLVGVFQKRLPPHLHLTTSKVMVIVWRLRGNIIRTVLYIANVLPLQWAQVTKTVHTARLGHEFVFVFFGLHVCFVLPWSVESFPFMFWRWRNKLKWAPFEFFAPSPLLRVRSWLHPF